MEALKAHVENGRIIADEPVELPDGTMLRVVPIDEADEEMSAAERAELEEAIEEGYADFDREDFMDATKFAATLVAKR